MYLQKKNQKLEMGEVLPLMEAFYTIQGEGYHKGSAAYFIRIGGCDVGCHWCDVKESWNPNLHPVTSITKIIDAAKHCSDTVVVTGGGALDVEYGTANEGLKVTFHKNSY